MFGVPVLLLGIARGQDIPNSAGRAIVQIGCRAPNLNQGRRIPFIMGRIHRDSGTDIMQPHIREEASMMAKGANIEIEPDDIDVSDTATFVWEIK